MQLELKIKDGKIDADDLLGQISTPILLKVIRSRNELDRVFTVNEMSDFDANRFRPLVCQIFGISEMSEDSELVREFCNKTQCKEQRVTLTLDI